MRWVAVAIVMAAAVQSANAADMPDFSNLPILRGSVRDGLSSRTVRWQGYYAGGQVGYGAADMNFNQSNSNLVSQLLFSTVIEADMGVSSWPVGGGKTSQRNSTFGGFVGHNSQWDDVVLGLEANYMHTNFLGDASGSAGRLGFLSDNNYHAVNYLSSASMRIHDMGTIRGRAGYVYQNFLPYLFAGVAIGHADIDRSVQIYDRYSPVSAAAALAAAPVVLTSGGPTNGHLIYGYSMGLGTDVMLFGNIFARAEWEYVRFSGAVDTSINTVRGGLGYKF